MKMQTVDGDFVRQCCETLLKTGDSSDESPVWEEHGGGQGVNRPDDIELVPILESRKKRYLERIYEEGVCQSGWW